MYKLSHILVYLLVQLPAHSKDFLQELPRSVFKNIWGQKQCLTDMFCEDGYDWKTLQKVINNFEKKACSIKNNYNNNTDKKQKIIFPWISKLQTKNPTKKYKTPNLE